VNRVLRQTPIAVPSVVHTELKGINLRVCAQYFIPRYKNNINITDTHPIPDATNADATSLAVAIHAQKVPNVKLNWFVMSRILINLPLASNLRADKVKTHNIINSSSTLNEMNQLSITVNKEGQCPSIQRRGSNCEEECQSDANCQGDHKCCFNGCGRSCLAPATSYDEQTTTTPAPVRGNRFTQCVLLDYSHLLNALKR
jgi:hypothetical protein